MGTQPPGTPRAWHLLVLGASADTEFPEMLGGSPDKAGYPAGTFWKLPNSSTVPSLSGQSSTIYTALHT